MALKLVKDSSPEAAAPQMDARMAEILDWLAAPPAQDATSELSPMRAHLASLGELDVSPTQFHRILDLFQGRAAKLTLDLKPRLREAKVPLPRSLRRISQDLMAIHAAVSAGYDRVLSAFGAANSGTRKRNPAVVASRALKSLAEQFQIAAMVYGRAPAGLWQQAHRLYREGRRDPSMTETAIEQSLDIERIYREMLALSAVQPPRLAPDEVYSAADYVTRFAAAVEISTSAPAQTDYRRYWFEPGQDMAPVAVARRLPPKAGEVWFFSCARLGLLAAEQVRELEAGTSPEHLHLPAEANEPRYRALLQRLHDAWVDPPTRQLVRRKHNYAVEACVGFAGLLEMFERRPDGSARPAPNLSTWVVLNESPAGYSLVHVQGDIEGISTGGVVAVRSGEARPWDICVIRWVRSDNPEHVELGLQVLSAGASTVRVAFRNPKTPREPVAGLLLPAVPAVRAHEAVLVPAGTCASRRFLMVHDEGKTHVVQGRMVNIDLQTAQVELFEFQHDPYPI